MAKLDRMFHVCTGGMVYVANMYVTKSLDVLVIYMKMLKKKHKNQTPPPPKTKKQQNQPSLPFFFSLREFTLSYGL